jgi:hypothetical protein
MMEGAAERILPRQPPRVPGAGAGVPGGGSGLNCHLIFPVFASSA